MELKDLVGLHSLSGVDFSNEDVKRWGDEFESCQVMRFQLGEKVYMVIEDPSDGYRSSMRDISVSDVPIKNKFKPIKVAGKHKTDGGYGQDDILELIDIKNGQVVLEVGTHNVDDYYPSFVANFQPINMSSNKK